MERDAAHHRAIAELGHSREPIAIPYHTDQGTSRCGLDRRIQSVGQRPRCIAVTAAPRCLRVAIRRRHVTDALVLPTAPLPSSCTKPPSPSKANVTIVAHRSGEVETRADPNRRAPCAVPPAYSDDISSDRGARDPQPGGHSASNSSSCCRAPAVLALSGGSADELRHRSRLTSAPPLGFESATDATNRCSYGHPPGQFEDRDPLSYTAAPGGLGPDLSRLVKGHPPRLPWIVTQPRRAGRHRSGDRRLRRTRSATSRT